MITGHDGITPEVLEKVNAELEVHGLIKVKIGKGPLPRKKAADQLVVETGAVLVQLLGRTVLLYRPQ